MGFFIPWHGQNKGLGREGPNRLDLKQTLIRKTLFVGQHLFAMCSNDLRRRFVVGVFVMVRFLGNSSPVHFQ